MGFDSPRRPERTSRWSGGSASSTTPEGSTRPPIPTTEPEPPSSPGRSGAGCSTCPTARSSSCIGHTHERTHPDVTVQTCWDADRLDLGRVGITPHPSRLCIEVTRRAETIRWANGGQPFGSSLSSCGANGASTWGMTGRGRDRPSTRRTPDRRNGSTTREDTSAAREADRGDRQSEGGERGRAAGHLPSKVCQFPERVRLLDVGFHRSREG